MVKQRSPAMVNMPESGLLVWRTAPFELSMCRSQYRASPDHGVRVFFWLLPPRVGCGCCRGMTALRQPQYRMPWRQGLLKGVLDDTLFPSRQVENALESRF